MLLPDDVLQEYPHYATLPVWLNGRIVPGAEAGISVWDHGFLYGDGVFEGIRVYDGGFFALRQHTDRLMDSLRGIGVLDLGRSVEDLEAACADLVARTGLRDAHVRLVVTRGIGQLGVDPSSCRWPTVVIMAYPMPPLLGRSAVRLLTSAVRRKQHDAIDPKIKSLNYLDGVLARFQARAAGMDGALLVDSNGFVAEGSGENIFWHRDGVWHTPTCVAALEGVTRGVLITLLEESAEALREGQYSLQDVYRADEVLLCGSGAEVVAVGEVDGRPIGTGSAGPRTLELARRYQEAVRTRLRTEIDYGR
jgi:branched-chain amino acid aminotransferase